MHVTMRIKNIKELHTVPPALKLLLVLLKEEQHAYWVRNQSNLDLDTLTRSLQKAQRLLPPMNRVIIFQSCSKLMLESALNLFTKFWACPGISLSKVSRSSFECVGSSYLKTLWYHEAKINHEPWLSIYTQSFIIPPFSLTWFASNFLIF